MNPSSPSRAVSKTQVITHQVRRWLLVAIVPILALCGCATANHSVLPKEQRLARPPEGKALINFHRVTNWGAAQPYPIFDSNGRYLCELPGNAEFQYVCAPGEQVFIGWADQVSVVKARVAANQTYDVMVDVAMGWMTADIKFKAMKKGDPRRGELPQFEKRERLVEPRRTEYIASYESKNQARVAEIKRDFLAGHKAERVQHLAEDDCR